MAFDVRVQNVLEKKPGLTDQGVATGVTKFRMASGELSKWKIVDSTRYCTIYMEFEENFGYLTEKNCANIFDYKVGFLVSWGGASTEPETLVKICGAWASFPLNRTHRFQRFFQIADGVKLEGRNGDLYMSWFQFSMDISKIDSM